MRTSCSLGSLLSISDVLACARRLADAREKVDTIWIPETWGMENFAMLGAVSGLAPAPRIGSSIINVYSRSPATIAMGAATIDTISGGRLVLGLGASSPAIVGGLHSMTYDRPLLRVQETVEIVRAAISGEKLDYSGRIFEMRGFTLLVRPPRADIPIYLAAVNQNMTRLAWDVADGVIFYLRPAGEMRSTIDLMSRSSGRRIDVACQLITCVSDDRDAAINRARRTIAFYVSVGKTYREFLASNGFGDETRAIYEDFLKSGLGGVHRHVPDGMVDALAVAGTPRECQRRLGSFREAGVSLPIMQFNPVGEDVAASFDLFAETFFA